MLKLSQITSVLHRVSALFCGLIYRQSNHYVFIWIYTQLMAEDAKHWRHVHISTIALALFIMYLVAG